MNKVNKSSSTYLVNFKFRVIEKNSKLNFQGFLKVDLKSLFLVARWVCWFFFNLHLRECVFNIPANLNVLPQGPLIHYKVSFRFCNVNVF